MGLNNLTPAKGSVKAGKRIARGQGSGRGGTSTRGHKGAKSRSGYSSKRAFEGGQMPLQMRLPKRGFKSPNKVSYVALNLDWLNSYAAKYDLKEVTIDNLVANGIVGKNDLVKILNRGELASALNVTAHAYSGSAKESIEKAGGTASIA